MAAGWSPGTVTLAINFASAQHPLASLFARSFSYDALIMEFL